MEYAFFLGSNPSLSAVEIHEFFSRTKFTVDYDFDYLPILLVVKTNQPFQPQAVIEQLGGSPAISRLAGKINELAPENIIEITGLQNLFVANRKPLFSLSFEKLISSSPSAINNAKDVRSMAIKMKRLMAKPGLRTVVPQKGTTLSSAQYFNAKLPFAGAGIHLLENGNHEFLVSILSAVQDIDFYTKRDRLRPETDPGKGMLPVKVAQMLINFAKVSLAGKIYDPFCGVGTIASEALLQGYHVAASDISPRQTERTINNIDWLRNYFTNRVNPEIIADVFLQDVEKDFDRFAPHSVDAIVSEGWLGPAINRQPSAFDIENTFVKVQRILYATLNNASKILKNEASVVIALPAFRIGNRVVRAPFLQDDFRKYLPKNFVVDPLLPKDWSHPVFRDASQGMMLYGRPDAVVLRDILRLKKK